VRGSAGQCGAVRGNAGQSSQKCGAVRGSAGHNPKMTQNTQVGKIS
jgi:hypothetical protein